MVCPTCNGVTASGQPCRRRTCKFAPKCFQHTSVAVRPSSIAGRGLFAKNNIRKGEIVGDYTVGTTRLTTAQFPAKYPSGRATHVWSTPGGVYYDAKDGRKSIAGMANRAPSGGKGSNAKINGGGKIMAKNNIPQGREILVGYGSGFRI